ncbi:gliding motility-associated C-terminal domain-containing protein [Fulvivirga ligni]|uniref:T9SS type B sorting domain-containing protein n=1 Tax=Fulvivirga ligni TaxID=2904246 RepID=UPI001F2FB145|nr:gliding motility-associated C-terminal domain-containing protein [Fulvivirga ligni]UII23827.1 gliding motility-associated C-terminal domain-containing protein [Fulvivirga ligni]
MKKALFYISIFLLSTISFIGKAQHSSTQGFFEVDYIGGCPGTTVTINFIKPCPTQNDCTVYFEYDPDDTSEGDTNPHTYTEPGNYRIGVFYPGDGLDYIDIEISDPEPPEFDIYKCSNNQVEVKVTDNRFDKYVINFGAGPTSVIQVPANAANASYSYSNNTIRNISVRGLNNSAFDNCSSNTKSVNPINSQLPEGTIADLQIIDESSIELRYKLPLDILYQLYIKPNNSGSWQRYGDHIYNIETQVINAGLNFKDNFYCFMVRPYNICDDTYTTANSNEICSIVLDLTNVSDANKLNWKTANPSVNFTLEKESQGNSSSQTFASVTRSYNDIDINCGVDYCYTIQANYSGGFTSRSLTRCGTAFSNTPPDRIQDISTVVNGSDIILSWPEVEGSGEYTIQRRNDTRFEIIGSSPSPTYTDSELLTSEASYCYQIGSTDECGNSSSQSTSACSILLTGNFNNDNTVNLQWSDYTGYVNGISSYIIEKNYPGSPVTTIDAGNNISYQGPDDNDNEQVVIYRIIAQANDNVESSISNTITLIKPNNIYYPNAFSPDNNGTNDTFEINGKYITSFALKIYNRWGELIFATEDMNEAWNGTLNGKELPLGTYAFIAEMTDMAGRDIKKTGTIMLIRK